MIQLPSVPRLQGLHGHHCAALRPMGKLTISQGRFDFGAIRIRDAYERVAMLHDDQATPPTPDSFGPRRTSAAATTAGGDARYNELQPGSAQIITCSPTSSGDSRWLRMNPPAADQA